MRLLPGRDRPRAGSHRGVRRHEEALRRTRRPAHARLRHGPLRMIRRLRSLTRRANGPLARFALVAMSGLLVAATLFPAAHASASTAITGGGSSFASLEIDQWRADTARNPYGLSVNYVSQGSTFGRQEFIHGNLDFGASDITFQPSEMGQLQAGRCGGRPTDTGCFVYVPVSAGGLAFMYNLTDNSGNRVNNLQLSRSAACKIFTGAITRWNDPEIVATNPQLAGF